MRRLAPVQCVFWGHPISQGLSSIDYFISSDLYEPSDAAVADRYHEQLIRLDGLSAYFSSPGMKLQTLLVRGAAQRHRSDTLSRLGLPSDARLYLIPQTLMKFHPDFDKALVSILNRDPHGVIVVTFATNQAVWQSILETRLASAIHAPPEKSPGGGAPDVFKRTGSSRVRFLPSLDHDSFLSLLGAVDCVLDPWPFGGGVTSLEALAMGTPVITLPSRQSVVQLASGFYRRMSQQQQDYEGAPWPVASDEEDFVKLATSIASGGSLRERLSDRIRNLSAVLYDDKDAADQWSALLVRLGRSQP